jgi:hypothetical protein
LDLETCLGFALASTTNIVIPTLFCINVHLSQPKQLNNDSAGSAAKSFVHIKKYVKVKHDRSRILKNM